MKTKDQLNIFFTIDKSYIQHFTVTLTSILENNKDLTLRVFVINDLEKISDLNKTINFIKSKYGITLELLSLDSKEFDKFKISHHISKATYFRLLLADIIPKDINCGLFIDSDTIVTGSLKYFTKLSFHSGDSVYSLYAVKDETENNIIRINNIGVAVTQYFNAGVMYVNLNVWRNTNASFHLTKIAEKFKQELLWWDQDVLNIFFADRWIAIPYIYNSFDMSCKAAKVPVIIHYTGYPKPWGYNKIHPYRNFYFKYLKLTPYKSFSPLAFAIKRRIKNPIKEIRLVFNNMTKSIRKS